MDTNELYNFIIVNEIATDAEVQLVTALNGYSVETMNNIIWARTEYHDIEQLKACEGDFYDFSMVSGLEDDEE